MKPKDIFSLAVRVLGLVFLYHGLLALPGLVSGLWGNFATTVMSILVAGWPLLVAYWLLRGAPLIMRLAYPDDGHSDSEHPILGASQKKADA